MTKKKKLLTALFTLVCLFVHASAQSMFSGYVTSPKYEVRAVWLTTFKGLDWPKTKATDEWSRQRQKDELVAMLDRVQAVHINTVLFQARTRGLVAYPSAIEQFDDVWTGKEGVSPGYDPLAFVIEECHKRNMECQAWVVAVPPARGYRNPNDPSTAGYVAAICEEIARNYDIDGISLDYIRYSDGKAKGVSQWQACDNITSILRTIHDRVKAVKPWAKISVSPIGKYKETINLKSKYNAYERGQDVERWTREGLVDQVYPMSYWTGKNFDPFIPQWAEIAHGKQIVPGLGIYFLDPREGKRTLNEQIIQHNMLRYNAGMGFAHFRAEFLINNTKGIYEFIRNFCPFPALIPPIAGAKSKPQQPKGVQIQRGKYYTTITWQQQKDCFVNVYASRQWPVDINESGNLLAVRVRGNKVVVPTSYKLNYALTSIDRYGNESNEISTAKEKPRTALSYGSRNSKGNR